MTTLPNTLVGSSPQPTDLELDPAMAVAVQPEIAQARFAKNPLKPEIVMVVLLAIWMMLAGVILGMTALSY
jgi:hypothetical protein